MLFGPRARWLRGLALLLALAGLAAACVTASPEPPPDTTTVPPLVTLPAISVSPSPTVAVVLLAPTQTPQPTATPFTHVEEGGDTLLSIAFRYSVSLDDLLAANPGVDPQLLSVGAPLIIPIGEEGLAVIPSPTPVSLIEGRPACYPTGDNGLWCFLPVLNEGPAPIEGATAQIVLYDDQGKPQASQVALPLLNLIPPGQVIPLMAFFPPVAPDGRYATGLLEAAFQLSAEDDRYLPARFGSSALELAVSGESAQITGTVLPDIQLEEGEGVEAAVWVAAVALAADGQVVGVRRWETEARLTSGAEIPFEFQVFTLGPPIDRVDLLVEVRRRFPDGS